MSEWVREGGREGGREERGERESSDKSIYERYLVCSEFIIGPNH